MPSPLDKKSNQPNGTPDPNLIAKADAGDMEAQYVLAQLYHHGKDGIEKDEIKALKYYQKAAILGHTEAQYEFGLMLDGDIGYFVKDAKKGDGAKYLKLAADKNLVEAQYRLGYNLFYGLYVDRNLPESIRYLKLAADADHTQAQSLVGLFYLKDEKKKAEAINYFQLAAAKNDKYSQFQLGHLYLQLEHLYLNGTGVEKNETKAFNYFKLAADNVHSDAQYMVGMMYAQGTGVPKNDTEASRYLHLYLRSEGSKYYQEKAKKAGDELTRIQSQEGRTVSPTPSSSDIPKNTTTAQDTANLDNGSDQLDDHQTKDLNEEVSTGIPTVSSNKENHKLPDIKSSEAPAIAPTPREHTGSKLNPKNTEQLKKISAHFTKLKNKIVELNEKAAGETDADKKSKYTVAATALNAIVIQLAAPIQHYEAGITNLDELKTAVTNKLNTEEATKDLYIINTHRGINPIWSQFLAAIFTAGIYLLYKAIKGQAFFNDKTDTANKLDEFQESLNPISPKKG